MLTERRKEISDLLVVGALSRICEERVCEKYNLTRPELEFLITIHIIQKTTNRYVVREEVDTLLCKVVSDHWFYDRLKVLLEANYIERVRQSQYNVTIEGLAVIRSYETILARKANEVRRGQVKGWKRVPNQKTKQVLNRQYPPRMLDHKKRTKIFKELVKSRKKRKKRP